MTNVLEQQWSRNDASDNSEDTIDLRFEQQVAAAPDELAIVIDDISLTYRALDQRANGFAAELTSVASQHNEPIVLFAKDQATLIAAMLGSLKANRIFIALAPNSPIKWVRQVIEDSGAAHIIVDSSTQSIANFAITGRVSVTVADQLARSSQSFLADRTASSDDTAYIVYTSGSTGRPKGVASSHRRLLRSSDVRNQIGGVGPGDRYANLRSSGVSSWIRNSLSPLLSGACLFPFDLHRHGLQNLAPWLIAQKITYLTLSASLLRTWLASIPDNLRFPDLRFVGVTSERLYAQDVVGLSRHLEGDWRIAHSYSSTEVGAIAAQTFTPSRLPDTEIVAVGRPVTGVEVAIKDETGAPVAPGEIGEIVVRSRFLAQGYWNNPELTAKVFQTDPLDGALRIYRTGDLGRWRADGALELAGRKVRRIRLRGYNIEPFEVECELKRHPGVSDAVVLMRDAVAGEEPCLVGYVVASPHTVPQAIRQQLVEHLPSYMVPSHIVILDSFPIASSGKIDRSALLPPKPEEAPATPYRSPSSDCEHQLLAIWREVLKIPKIGIDDDFFELGGTSLQALILFARIETQLGCSLSPTTIVQAPTIARLANFIQTSTGIVESQSLVPLRVSGTGLPLFLVHNRYCFVVYYRHLLRSLKSDRPVFGLQPLPLDGKHRIARTIESIAADYVAEIRSVQPHGPYFIAGHSFGGRVSFEIAQQLVRSGEHVSFLGLIDTGLRGSAHAEQRTVSPALTFNHHLYGFFRKLRWIREAVLMRLRTLRLRLGYSIAYEDRPAYYDRLCSKANRQYVPRPYSGHITMFSSMGNSVRQRSYWGPIARGGLTVLEVPASHDDMVLPPHSKLLAEHFDACLNSTENKSECSPH